MKLSIPERSKKQWCRKPLAAIDAKKDDITFQQMDTDYYVAVRTLHIGNRDALHFLEYDSKPFKIRVFEITSCQAPRTDLVPFAKERGITYKVYGYTFLLIMRPHIR